MNILIAEDEPALRENLQWMLEMEGYTVNVAGNGHDAFEAACQSPPDLVLTDVMMPGEDGFSLATRLRITRLGRRTFRHSETTATPRTAS